MKKKITVDVPFENKKFMQKYKERWDAMKRARQPYDQKRDNIDYVMLKKPQFDSYGNYLVALKEEQNVMEMSSGRE